MVIPYVIAQIAQLLWIDLLLVQMIVLLPATIMLPTVFMLPFHCRVTLTTGSYDLTLNCLAIGCCFASNHEMHW